MVGDKNKQIDFLIIESLNKLYKISSSLIRRRSHRVLVTYVDKKVNKGAWRMPWVLEAKKDVISCDKLRGLANTN